MAAIDKLKSIMAALRHPETGCPWDLQQDFQSIARYTIEEAYEVVDAIERADYADLKDELGDLLLQVVFHARMAEEAGLFNFDDVVEAIADKMIRRHPHVFSDDTSDNSIGKSDTSAAQVKQSWEAIKDRERAEKAGTDETSLLDDIPQPLPGLTRAIKLQKRAARIGFDWPDANQVWAKIEEELGELKAEIEQDNATARKQDELGDVLFVMANLARHMGVDPEAAIRGGNQKFTRRFKWMEQKVKASGKSLDAYGLPRLEELWQQAKQKVG